MDGELHLCQGNNSKERGDETVGCGPAGVLRIQTEGHGDEEGVHPRSEEKVLGRVDEAHPLRAGCSVGTQQRGAFVRRHGGFAGPEGVTECWMGVVRVQRELDGEDLNV